MTTSLPTHIIPSTHTSVAGVRNPVQKDIRQLVGKGYKDIWNFRGRYLAVKGSRGSKKSTTIAIRSILHIMQYEDSNMLVIRQVKDTIRGSVRAQLVRAITMLGVEHLWHIPKSDLTLTYKPTGQQIIFRGLDDPLKITSIQVEHGYLTWVWFEEAFEILREEDFNKVDLSIRGQTPGHLWKQIIFTFNPWSEKHWIKARFFDRVNANGYSVDGDIMAVTTTYKDNEFLDKADLKVFSDMKAHYPRRYDIEGRGNWGIAEGLVFENFMVTTFDYKKIIRSSIDIHGRTHLKVRFGLDFGFTNDVAALIACIVDEKNMKIYIFDEFYKEGQTNKMLSEMLKYKGYHKDVIRADSAEPKSIAELKSYGIRRAVAAQKGPDSIRHGILRLQDYELIVHAERCPNTVIELNNYVWDKDKKTDRTLNVPVDEYNHLMDALRYATEDIRTVTFRF